MGLAVQLWGKLYKYTAYLKEDMRTLYLTVWIVFLAEYLVFGRPGDEILGDYVRYPATNGWHYVSLCKTSDCRIVYKWINEDKHEWTMYYVGEHKGIPRYAVGTNCPTIRRNTQEDTEMLN